MTAQLNAMLGPHQSAIVSKQILTVMILHAGAVLMVCPPVPVILNLDPDDSSADLAEQQQETRSVALVAGLQVDPMHHTAVYCIAWCHKQTTGNALHAVNANLHSFKSRMHCLGVLM